MSDEHLHDNHPGASRRFMQVTCSQCGEELLGAVNCCWKCGTKFALRPEMDGRPPFRRPPMAETAAAAPPAEVVTVAEASGEAVPINIRRGSPFDAAAKLSPAPRSANGPENATAAVSATPAVPAQPPADYADRYSEHVVSVVAAVLSVVLGLASVVMCFYFPIGALAVAVFGLALGVWGLYSERRGVAVIGLILCCIALSFGGFRSVVQLYTSIYGFSPWQSEDEANMPDDGTNEGQ